MGTKKEIRSKYIRNLVEDAASTSEKIQDATKDAVETLLESTINESLRKLISEKAESDNKENEEESTPDFIQDENGQEEIETAAEEEETPEEEVDTVEVDTVETPEEEEETDTDEGEESDWTDFEQFKDEDGEYDLTGQDDETVYKVLMAMDPEKDGIRLVKNDDGKFTLTDDNTEKEYIIDLECGDGEEPEAAEVTAIDEELGYTDDYQNKTAMTTPSNNEPSKFGRTWDKGVPTGTEKPWVGDGAKEKGHPYNDKVNECGPECGMDECGKLYEIELDSEDEDMDFDMEMDEGTSIANGSRVMGKKGDTNHSEEDRQRHVHKDYERIMNEEKQKYANLERKLNAIIAENKELKGFATKISEKLRQSAVINVSMGKVTKLMLENSTTKEEKTNIINRFSALNSVDECNRLYETISEELKNRGTSAGSKIASDKPLVESKNSGAKETKMLDSSDAKEVIDFMTRLEKIKK